MAEDGEADFKAEYAKSNRASCKMCHRGIGKDSLRVAVMVQSPHFDGKVPNWHHPQCFWKRAKVTSQTQIHGYDALRWEDQQSIKEKIGSGGGGNVGAGDGAGLYTDFGVEYAKSSASKCRGCENKIDKNETRAGKKEYDSQRAKMYGPYMTWYHMDCFNEEREELGFTEEMDPSKIPQFNRLKKEDQDEVIEKLGKGKKVKRKASDAKGPSAKKSKTETAEDKALKEQSKLLWEFRDKLTKDVSNQAMKVLLEYNSQDIPPGESRLLDRVSDCLGFGALKPCPECKGQLVYSGSGYHCTGNLTEWTKCMHVTKQPERKAFKVPKEFHDVEFLKQYKYVKRERVFPKETAASGSGLVSSAESSGGAAWAARSLSGMKVVFAGKLSESKTKLTKKVTDLGGTVVSKIDKKVACVVSNQAEVDKNSKLIQEAKKADVHVVDEAFLEAVAKGGAALLITSHSICSWGSDPHDRIEDVVDGGPVKSFGKSKAKSKREEKAEKMWTKSVPDTMKMKVKGGAAVDPDSGLAETAHILQDKGEPLAATLGLVDIARGTNSYYKLQLLETDKNNCWYVFRAWGRVGTTIGGNKIERCGSKSSGISTFCALYEEKTGNEWENKKNFVKYPKKFYPLDIDYGADDEEVKKLDASAGSNSLLPKEVQDLVKLIFDVETMKKTMLEFEIDMKKMPLGKLSKKQIQSAYKVLTELQTLVEEKGTPTKFLDASNRFYTLIPHDFGMKKPPMLDTAEVVKTKTDMLDNLLEIEVAYSLLKTGEETGQDPIDIHFEKLNTEMEVLDKAGEEFKRLVDYVQNTHGSTHTHYDLEIEDVFKMKRPSETKRFKPFKQLHNRKLLWHGSRVTNYAGILSQGLRIAPPEAPVTGYMFGKGIYFADMVSKSANYCATSKSSPTGLMLLCEVALGNMHELSGASYITQLPKGKHSTKGCGKSHPDPSATYTTPDGVDIPMGKGVPAPMAGGYSSLLYNEFIVYDVAQVQMQYLLKMNFKYKYGW